MTTNARARIISTKGGCPDFRPPAVRYVWSKRIPRRSSLESRIHVQSYMVLLHSASVENLNMRNVYGISLILVQVVLAIILMLLFFSLAPWITCQPLSELQFISSPPSPIPDYAQCFNNNHGNVTFSARLPRAQDPVGFFRLTALFLACFIGLLGLNHLHRKQSKDAGEG